MGNSVWLRLCGRVYSFKPSLEDVHFFLRESWLRYGFGRTRRKPRLCAYNEGSVWLETGERGAGRPMQGTFSGVHAHYRRAVPTIRAAVCLFACLFHYCPFGGPKWHHLARSIITIVDMSRVYTGWFGDPGDEAPHRICFPIWSGSDTKNAVRMDGLLLELPSPPGNDLVKGQIDWQARPPSSNDRDDLCK
ncbi:hypothetical protein F5883DRAFT_572705, partial [Diaporthe sp. PMI_573]